MRIVLLLVLITVSEATIGVFVKLTGDAIPIQTLNFYALSFAAAFLAMAIPHATGRPLRFPRGNVKDTVIIGALIAAQISVFNYAMTLVPIANAVVFWSVAPFFVFIFSALFLGEPAKKSYMLIFGLALTGIVLARPLAGGEWFGNLVALSTGAIYAGMVTYMRHEGREEAGNDIFWSMAAGAILLSPALVLAGPGEIGRFNAYPALSLSLPVMLWPVCLGVVSTGFAYFGISLVLKKISANIYSLVDIIVSPIVAATLGSLVFSEVPTQGMILGGGLLLLSGFWLTREMSRGKETAAVHPCQCERMNAFGA
ncbi:MAG: EamA family transporter [Rhodobacterales bacterium 34-62-10]|jgi:drug/metabolite transporter (DMT)-like permease|uniref:EamA family transporter n=1 Tax=Thalassobius vesicularis TaxID=1294297 RepID=A0A4S3M5Y4_9RHOB|nr:DMT family transporter [Thalassobius vesicularis]MCE8522392.1 EamA family transporter [Ruegeria pomeroyi]MCE8529838.1 EamA family transporter [Ruegeria pomeroyi]OZB20180.1 MAG: EamA family transporter [Rhodobacterales bacterium 34-62-10]THD72317.1 EamA family transporter [Thalassobius vesicularis]